MALITTHITPTGDIVTYHKIENVYVEKDGSVKFILGSYSSYDERCITHVPPFVYEYVFTPTDLSSLDVIQSQAYDYLKTRNNFVGCSDHFITEPEQLEGSYTYPDGEEVNV